MSCPCCSDERCCCENDGDLSALLTRESPCDGQIIYGTGEGCSSWTITVEWCGQSLTYSSGDPMLNASVYASATDCGVAPCTVLELVLSPGGGYGTFTGFAEGCQGRCWGKLWVQVSQYKDNDPCNSLQRAGVIRYREGCENEPYYEPIIDNDLCDCTELEPAVTLTFAP